ncbi:MAG TPA: aspartate dehydrogenase [Caulobacteraceae bacterium]|nr:aspartate dehydrogenase [Caulobacteraceae bacterium]
MKIGLIGNGAIAGMVSYFCLARPADFELVGALTLSRSAPSAGRHPLTDSLDVLLAMRPRMIVECAGHTAVAAHATDILTAGVDLIIASTGSLADARLLESIRQATAASSARVRAPAGALPGVDALSAARLGGLSSVTLRSAKPPRAWAGTAAEPACRLDAITAATILFEGDARQAALTYPKNANVAATAALAGLGFERTKVQLVADPALSCNVHRLEAAGAFGEMALEVRANPAPGNPKTSYLAALSIMRLLENETAGIAV